MVRRTFLLVWTEGLPGWLEVSLLIESWGHVAEENQLLGEEI